MTTCLAHFHLFTLWFICMLEVLELQTEKYSRESDTKTRGEEIVKVSYMNIVTNNINCLGGEFNP